MDVDEQERWLAERFNQDHEYLLLDEQWLHLKYSEPTLEDVPDDAALTVTQLIKRGFTRTAIERHLSPVEDVDDAGLEPLEDDFSLEAANYPHNHYKTPFRYYSAAEAKKAASTPELKEWLERTKERRRKLRTEQKETIEYALGVTIAVDTLERHMAGNPAIKEFNLRIPKVNTGPDNPRHYQAPLYPVIALAVREWNARNQWRIDSGEFPLLDMHSTDQEVINRIGVVTTRFIRDEMSNYHLVWSAFKTRPAAQDTRQILKIKTAVAITRMYPRLTASVNYVCFHPKGWTDPRPAQPAEPKAKRAKRSDGYTTITVRGVTVASKGG